MNTEELTKIFTRIDNVQTMRIFFQEIFTPAERKDLSLRWELMKMLKQGKPQRKIASDLGISLCKITRGAKIIKNPKSITNQILNRNTDKKEKRNG